MRPNGVTLFFERNILDSGVNEKLAEPFMASLAAKGTRICR